MKKTFSILFLFLQTIKFGYIFAQTCADRCDNLPVDSLIDLYTVEYSRAMTETCPEESDLYDLSDVKLLIDSCLWQKYYNGEIKEGHSRILCYFLLNKKGKVDDVYFSEPLSASDEEFYSQVTSAIKKVVEDYSFCREGKWLRHNKKRTCFPFLYKINLYP